MTQQKPIILPDLDDDQNDLLNALVRQLERMQPRNLLRASYYDMKRVITQVTPVVPPQYYRLGLILGWSAKAVDALARRCNLDGYVWPDGDLDSLGMTTWWEQNGLRTESNSAIVSSLIHSPSFLINVQGETGEPISLLHVKDALDATGMWNHRTRRLTSVLEVTDRDKSEITGLVLYLDGLTVTGRMEGGRWSSEVSAHPWGIPVEPLPYRPRHRRPMGSSRISRAVMGLQDAAVRELVRGEGHMDVYSYPELFLLGANASDFKDEAGNPFRTWQVALGRIRGLLDDEQASSDALARANIEQVAAADPTPHLAWLNALAKLFARETSLPDTALAISDMVNPTSAESYDASQYELIAEAEGAVDDWTLAFKRAALRGLAIQNDLTEIPTEWQTVAPKWRNPRYLARSAEADAGQKQLAAMPWLANTSVGLELLGLDAQQIKQALAERSRAQGSSVLQTLQAVADQRAAAAAAQPADLTAGAPSGSAG